MDEPGARGVLASVVTLQAPTTPGASRGYWAVAVALAPPAVDAVANFLWEAGATGVVEEADPGLSRLRAFFPPGTDAAATRERLVGYLAALRALGLAVGPAAPEVTAVVEEPWAEAWRRHFRPLAVGRRLLVAPPWEVPADAQGRRLLLIEPGRAFGTGGHATTRACLELLERTLERAPAAHVLDVGTGSGILAIAAARLGVPAVTALDVDPDAVAAAMANAARNGVGDRVRVAGSDVAAWSGPPAPLVVANLLGTALVALAPVLARLGTPACRLLAGGLLVHEVPAVVASYTADGFALAEVLELEGWASILLAR